MTQLSLFFTADYDGRVPASESEYREFIKARAPYSAAEWDYLEEQFDITVSEAHAERINERFFEERDV